MSPEKRTIIQRLRLLGLLMLLLGLATNGYAFQYQPSINEQKMIKVLVEEQIPLFLSGQSSLYSDKDYIFVDIDKFADDFQHEPTKYADKKIVVERVPYEDKLISIVCTDQGIQDAILTHCRPQQEEVNELIQIVLINVQTLVLDNDYIYQMPEYLMKAGRILLLAKAASMASDDFQHCVMIDSTCFSSVDLVMLTDEQHKELLAFKNLLRIE